MSAPRLALGLVLIVALLAPGASQSLAQPAASPAAPAFPAAPGAMLIVENAGQWPAAARFQVWGGPAGSMWLADDAIWITVLEPEQEETHAQPDKTLDPRLRRLPEEREQPMSRRGVAVKLSFVGANLQPRIEPFDRLDTVVSYFYGNDPAQWRPGVPVWGGVRYVDLYPGIDLELTHEGGRMVQRVAARPGADLAALQLRVEGADAVVVDGDHLRLSTAAGEHALSLLQTTGYHDEATVQARGPQVFDVSAPFAAPAPTSYSTLATPDSLADNPADLLYSTFLGGRDETDQGNSITVDAAGNAYVTGQTWSDDFPVTPGAFDPSHNGFEDAFVVKINPAGNELTYATFLGGSSDEGAWAITVDATGSAYITGSTRSSNFPTTLGVFDPVFNGGWNDAFVVKLNPAGSGLSYATFLGGSSNEGAFTIAVDAAGRAYVAGETNSSDFPSTQGAFDTSHNGFYDAFIAKLNPAGETLSYATFLGGSRSDHGRGVAVDAVGSAYVTGQTWSGDFPVTPGAFDPSQNGSKDVFVAKLNPAGSELSYATFLGGISDEGASAIAVDGVGSAYVTGGTDSSSFPTTPGAFDPTFNGGWNDAFAAKLNPSGSALAYATFLGGGSYDESGAIALDGTGSAYVIGRTQSTNFPATPGAFDASHNGNNDAFLARLDPTGSGLVYATFLGGSGDESAHGVAVDATGNAFVTGGTLSGDFPTTPDAFDPSYNGSVDAFVAKLNTETELGDQPVWLPIVLRQR